jgi:hypothetical protein
MATQGGIAPITADVTVQPPEPQRLQSFHGLQQQRPQPVVATEFPRTRVVDPPGHLPVSQAVVTSAAATTATAAAATMLGMAARSMGQETARSAALPPTYYSPSFQSHFNQLGKLPQISPYFLSQLSYSLISVLFFFLLSSAKHHAVRCLLVYCY